MEYYSAIKNQNSVCNNMCGPADYILREVREKQISYAITYMRSQKNDTNEVIYKTEIDSQT